MDPRNNLPCRAIMACNPLKCFECHCWSHTHEEPLGHLYACRCPGAHNETGASAGTMLTTKLSMISSKFLCSLMILINVSQTRFNVTSWSCKTRQLLKGYMRSERPGCHHDNSIKRLYAQAISLTHYMLIFFSEKYKHCIPIIYNFTIPKWNIKDCW